MKIEKWKSNKRQREDHYYTDSNVYLFGFNPEYFDAKKVRKFFKKMMKK